MARRERPLDSVRSEGSCDRRQRPHHAENGSSVHGRARELHVEPVPRTRHDEAGAIRPVEQERVIFRRKRNLGRPFVWLMCAVLVISIPSVLGGVMQQAIRGKLPQRTQFMPKSELLSWLNQLLQSDFTKVEQCANGAPYCQVLDALFPEEFPLKRVHFGAKAEHDSIRNYKIIQQFFLSKGISKSVDVDRLLKGRPMDNLEFLQWLKGFYDENDRGLEYDAVDRRRLCAGGQALAARGSKHPQGSRYTASPRAPTQQQQQQQLHGLSTPHHTTPHPRQASTTPYPGMTPHPRMPSSVPPGERGLSVSVGRNQLRPSEGPHDAYADPNAAGYMASPVAGRVGNSPGAAAYNAGHLTREIEALHHTVSELEKERNFYYDRLRAVELLCQDTVDSHLAPAAVAALCKQIMEMMYTEDEGAGEPGGPEDNLNLNPAGSADETAQPAQAAAEQEPE